jgi:hypothetical protein
MEVPMSDNHSGSSRESGNLDSLNLTVEITYLEMLAAERRRAPPVDQSFEVVMVNKPDVAFYRYLYSTVGAPWMWWRRRLLTDSDLQELLWSPNTQVYVLYRDGQPSGFFELDLTSSPDVELAYFGLLPFQVGTGRGRAALEQTLMAIDALYPRKITVNTCTADHPRALNSYLTAGFKIVGRKTESWSVPRSTGLHIPAHLAPR